tara:strand:- start:1516 stop:2721 length:1206 start_codon:yes stop_codon:yes gene_type:complete
MDYKKSKEKIKTHSTYQSWNWWPLLPLYPYGLRKTFFTELVPNQVWSFEQLQGIYYVAVPVRLTVVKVSGGLMILNPLPPTKELLEKISQLQKDHGPVKTIVLPTASGLEHKISLPALARCFPKSKLWICPGQWSFPFDLPLDWLGIPKKRTNILFSDGLPHKDICEWISLGPINIGLGRFQEISCYHKPSKSLLVTDALVGISEEPPALFDLDPTPLLFHSREKGSEPLFDSIEARKKGWKRLVLFASYLRPSQLDIPSVFDVFRNAFNTEVLNPKSHFGIYPFSWRKDWESSAKELLGTYRPLVQIAPVIERLVFPRAKEVFLAWLEELRSIKEMNWLISAHYLGKVSFTSNDVQNLKGKIEKREWAPSEQNWKFLGWLDKKLLDFKVVPLNPMSKFKD